MQTYTVHPQLKSSHIEKHNKNAVLRFTHIILIPPIALTFPFLFSVLEFFQKVNFQNFDMSEYPYTKIPSLIVQFSFIAICIFLHFKSKGKHPYYIDESMTNETITIFDTYFTYSYTLNNIHHKKEIPYESVWAIEKDRKFNFLIIHYTDSIKINEKRHHKGTVQCIPLYFINSEELETELKQTAKKENPDLVFLTKLY